MSINRAQGATDAGADDWEAKQVAAVNGYLAQLGRLVGAEPALLTAFADALDAGGTDQQMIDQIRQVSFVQDVGAVAGTYPDAFRNAQFQADLTALAAQLGAAADTSPPTTTPALAGPAGKDGWYTGPVQVTLTATGPDGAADVASTQYSVDGDTPQAYTAPFTVASDGVHTVSFWSTDRARNAERHESTTFSIDVVRISISDAAGNVGTTTVAAVVPHDQR